ncbi:hypothetical protein MMC13_008342 [Lambiella insularis]|nr:hypothetical protein [Lambiella insularis]
MDGEYQCNRNRHNLRIPDGTASRRCTEVNFQVRQQEIMLTDGSIWAKPWRFEKIGIVQNNVQELGHRAPYDGEYVGTIEVVVLRCSPVSQEHAFNTKKEPSAQRYLSRSKSRGKKAHVGGSLDGAAELVEVQSPGPSTLWSSFCDGTNELDSGTMGKFIRRANGQRNEPDHTDQHKSTHWGFQMIESDAGIYKPLRERSPRLDQAHNGVSQIGSHQRLDSIDGKGGSSSPTAHRTSPAVIINISHPKPRGQDRRDPNIAAWPDRDSRQNLQHVKEQSADKVVEIQSWNNNDNKYRFRTLSDADASNSWDGSHQDSQGLHDTVASRNSIGQRQRFAPTDKWDSWPESSHRNEDIDSTADWVDSLAEEVEMIGNRTDHDCDHAVEENSRRNNNYRPVGPNMRRNPRTQVESTRTDITRNQTEYPGRSKNRRPMQGGEWWTESSRQWNTPDKQAVHRPRGNFDRPLTSGSIVSDTTGNTQGTSRRGTTSRYLPGAWPVALSASPPSSPKEHIRQEDREQPIPGRGQKPWDAPIPSFVKAPPSIRPYTIRQGWPSQCKPSRDPAANLAGKQNTLTAQAQVPNNAHSDYSLNGPVMRADNKPFRISALIAKSSPGLAAQRDFDPRDEESLLYAIPEEVAQRHNISHQVQTGPPVLYHHKMATPRYMDSHESPYAVFVFHYRSQTVIEQMLNVDAQESDEQEKERLKCLTKDEIIDHFVREKVRKYGFQGNVLALKNRFKSSRARSSSVDIAGSSRGVNWEVPPKSSSNGSPSGRDIDMSQVTDRLNHLQTDSSSMGPPLPDQWEKLPERTSNEAEYGKNDRSDGWGSWGGSPKPKGISEKRKDEKAWRHWAREGGNHWNHGAGARKESNGDANVTLGGQVEDVVW